MSTQGLMVGTIVFAVLGVVGCIVSAVVVSRQKASVESSRSIKRDNHLLGILVVFMTVFCMWIHWICAYMHQMNPITPPSPEVHKE